MNKIVLVGLIFITITSGVAQSIADEIINKSIKVAGGERFEKATTLFTFRGKQYRSVRNNGDFQLGRVINVDNEKIQDIVSNKGLSRTINNCPIVVADSLITRISDGVNSVHYFASLPYGLNAPAVNKELVGEITIKNTRYYKIKVTFDKEGGGTDYEDEFMYWVHKEKYTVDYIAYKYAVNGGGIRFREAYNPRIVNGIRFVDYNNYKETDLSTPLDKLDEVFEQGELKLLSKILLEDIYVYLSDDCC